MITLALRKQLLTPQGPFDLTVDATIQEGEFVTIFGRSGAGKTTLLRMLSGLAEPDAGRIVVGEETWYDSARRINLAPQKRRIGYVFQDYALFPNMSVRENLVYAMGRAADARRIDELLDLVDLAALQQRLPATLSGGQQQRVALARAVARQPRLLLLDEPLSALDAEMRTRLQDEILRLHRRLGITTLIVSHDLSEVFKLSQRVLVIEGGRVTRDGRPMDLFGSSAGGGSFRFLGELLDIHESDVVYVLSVLIGNNVVKVIATEQEVADLRVGDRIIVSVKAFNPMIFKATATARAPD